MPRRPVKNPKKQGFQPGQIANPHGRPRGSKSKITEEVREAFAMLLESQIPNLQDWLERAAAKDPIKALDLFTKISERFVPALTRTEITGADGEAFNPITINLPNIPKVSLSVGESSPQSLIAPPGEEPKQLGEGSLTDVPENEVNEVTPLPTPMFQIPKLALSPNQLQDLKSMGEVPPQGWGETLGMGQEGLDQTKK